MYRLFSISVALTLLGSCINVYALPFVDSDAFVIGDSMAVRDIDTDLVWLDFGVNHGQSFNNVMAELDTTYADWRLPTEQEVTELWDKLTSYNGEEALYSLFELWGANKTPLDHLPFSCWGYFIDEDGYLGAGTIVENGTEMALYGPDKFYADGQITVSLGKKVVEILYDGSDYYPFSASGMLEISTLLVKKQTVPAPAPLLLLGLGLVFLILGKRERSSD